MADEVDLQELLDAAASRSTEGEEWMVMRHGDHGGTAVVTVESFEQSGGHQSKGWQRVTDAGGRRGRAGAAAAANPEGA